MGTRLEATHNLTVVRRHGPGHAVDSQIVGGRLVEARRTRRDGDAGGRAHDRKFDVGASPAAMATERGLASLTVQLSATFFRDTN